MYFLAGEALPERFDFAHPDLRRSGTYFVRGEDRLVLLETNFGDMRGSLALDRLASSLQLPADAPDRQLLGLVPPALCFRRQVQAGDDIPSELIDGSPSWTPKAHVIQRAATGIWRALRGATSGADGVAAPADDLRQIARIAIGLLPAGITVDEAESRLHMLLLDLARMDWLRRATSTMQRTVGELAQFSAAHAGEPAGDLARRSALHLREAAVWGTAKAVAGDAVMADVKRLLAEPAVLRRRAWPLIATLRALILDVEPVVLKWQAARERSDGPRLRDLEDIARLCHQRWSSFDPALYALHRIVPDDGGSDV